MYNLFSILSTLIHFSPIRAFSPLWSYTVHFVHLGSVQSILSTSVQSSPHWSNSVHFIYLGPRQSDLVRFSLFCLLRFYLVHLFLFGLIRSTLFLFGLFGPILSNGPLCSIWSNSVHLDHLVYFVPLWSIFVHLHNGKKHV